MGKKTRTITEYYCDVCNSMCYENDSFIKVYTSMLDMSGGKSFISGKLILELDGITDTIICKVCQYEYLSKYLKSIEPKEKCNGQIKP